MESAPQSVLFADVHLWQRSEREPPEPVGERKAASRQ